MKNKIFNLIICLIVFSKAVAADFSAESNGQLLYYNIVKHTHSVELVNGYHDRKADGKPHCYVQFKISFKKKASVVNDKVAKKDKIKYTGNVVIPQTVQYRGEKYKVASIAKYAFDGCTTLKSVSIPEGVTTIGASAFNHCENLKSLIIPNSVKSIGWGAFQGAGLTSVNIPNEIEHIEDFVFSGCLLNNSITFPNNVIIIDEYAFAANTSLTNIIIPNTVTTIEKSAFNNCINLKTITIPESVKRMGEGTFDICRNLEQISLQSTEPIKLSDKFFENVMSTNISLRVPKGSAESYKKADGWRHITSITEY